MNRKLILTFFAAAALTAAAFTLISRQSSADPAQPESIRPTDLARPDPRLAEAQKQNGDTVAWLTVPGTSIDGPVLQGADNDTYLRRNELGETDYRGCLFADYESNLSSAADLSRNTVVYGHTFTDGYTGGFFDLAQYRSGEWAKQHQEIYLSVADAMLKYKVASVGIAQISDGTLPIYCNVNDEEYRELLALASRRSEIDLGCKDDLTAAESILTLATCTEDSSERLVIVCIPEE